MPPAGGTLPAAAPCVASPPLCCSIALGLLLFGCAFFFADGRISFGEFDFQLFDFLLELPLFVGHDSAGGGALWPFQGGVDVRFSGDDERLFRGGLFLGGGILLGLLLLMISQHHIGGTGVVPGAGFLFFQGAFAGVSCGAGVFSCLFGLPCLLSSDASLAVFHCVGFFAGFRGGALLSLLDGFPGVSPDSIFLACSWLFPLGVSLRFAAGRAFVLRIEPSTGKPA